MVLGCLCAVSALADDAGFGAGTSALNNWPQWRGPLANGVAPRANPPIHWSETNNVRWKISLPGQGHSSPIVFGDAIYLSAAVPVGEAQKPVFDNAPGVHDSVPVTHRFQFVALAISRRDGGVSWKKVLREEWPHEGGHVIGSLASNSPVTDGEHLYVFSVHAGFTVWI
jgi:outer membrane protein assembly factor BamB